MKQRKNRVNIYLLFEYCADLCVPVRRTSDKQGLFPEELNRDFLSPRHDEYRNSSFVYFSSSKCKKSHSF